jgi:ELWxxDGT repeat protein
MLALFVESTSVAFADDTPGGTPVPRQLTEFSGTIPGELDPDETWLVAMGDRVYFHIDGMHWDGEDGVWVSDGTPEGTKNLLVVRYPRRPSVVGERLFFLAHVNSDAPMDYNDTQELWVINGNGSPQKLGNPVSYYLERVALGDRLFFSGQDSEHGRELWVSDGTPQGTTMVADVHLGPASSDISDMAVAGNLLYFQATDLQNGSELWVSDGTKDGTRLLKDIVQGAGSSDLSELTAVEQRLFFTAHDPMHGWSLWVSDGTSAGTELVKDGSDGYPTWLTAMGDRLVFTLGDSGAGLWVSDGTSEGTGLLKDIQLARPGQHWIEPAIILYGRLFFQAYDSKHGSELWVSDGTVEGTGLVKGIVSGSDGSLPYWLGTFGHWVIFAIYDPGQGVELWRNDGRSLELSGLRRSAETGGTSPWWVENSSSMRGLEETRSLSSFGYWT